MRKVLVWGYLLLAVLGAVLPWQANLEFMQTASGAGFDLSGFIRDANLRDAAPRNAYICRAHLLLSRYGIFRQ